MAYSAQCFSSDYTYGYSNNAAAGGRTWGMSSSTLGVPSISGMDINGVIYRYTVVKDREDPYTVSIQNENASGSGYIFRSTDDWSGRDGNTIQRYIPIPYSPVGNWGTGSIDEVGIGELVEPQVVYTFRIDPCFDPQNDPSCPNYQPPLPELPVIEVYNAMDDESVKIASEKTDESLYKRDTDEKSDSEGEDEGERLETALSASENALGISNGISQGALLQAMNIATNMNTYYAAQIQGGTYKESVVLKGGELPDNKNGRRMNFATQIKHDEMVKQQWR